MQLIHTFKSFGFMTKFCKHVCVLLGLVTIGEHARASYHSESSKQVTPPVGSRVYVVPAENAPYGAVEVVEKSSELQRGKVFMRDPIKISAEPVANKKPMAIPSTIKPNVKFKPSRLRFPNEPIAGRYAKPRVKFEQIGGTISHANMQRDIDLKARMIDDAEIQAKWLQSDW